ncbi:oxidoreductase [Tricladium varicosporioides]|nr:oxidoreductase [Hymenoscyphus varicosporioides]
MPTKRYFSQCPEFPSDVSVLNIPDISFSELQKDAEKESEKLYNACTEHGFFALDLGGSEDGRELLKQAEKCFDIGTETFDLGSDVLNKYAYKPPSLLGYKATGKLKTDDGKLDIMEMYTISQDDILGTGTRRENPEPVEAHREDCQEFFRQAHKALCVVYSHLNKKLALDPGTLAALSPLDKPSDTSLRLLMSRPQPAVESDRVTLTGHTDIGTITMLFHVVGGLQILPVGCENISLNWRYIRPRPDCVVINVGDTLVEWTGGVLRSSLHRVLTAPGEQASVPRQSLAYLVRPGHNATMRRLKSNGVVPPASEGDEEDIRSVDDWAAGRVRSIILGEVKPQGRGGRSISLC